MSREYSNRSNLGALFVARSGDLAPSGDDNYTYSYSFTPKLLIEALVQYNDRSDEVISNWRRGSLQTAKAGLYVVHNETSEIGDSHMMRDDDRSLIIKFSHVVDLLN